MRITRKQTYSALAGAGILLGAAGLANAATGGSPTTVDPVVPVEQPVADPGDADGGLDANEAGEADEGPENEADEANEDSENEADEPSYTSSITTADDSESANEDDEAASLAALATISDAEASSAALAAQPGTVTKVELENENGNVVYSVEIDTGNGTVDVKIDAGNASVLSTEADDGDEGDDGDGGTEDEGTEATEESVTETTTG